MARFLVTGGAGFIGGHLVRSLLADGGDVEVVDDLSIGRRSNVPEGAELIEVDLGSDDATASLPDHHYDAVLHLAGQSSGEKSFDDPIHDLDANARSTLALALWARGRGVPVFLHASSMGTRSCIGGCNEGCFDSMALARIYMYDGDDLIADAETSDLIVI